MKKLLWNRCKRIIARYAVYISSLNLEQEFELDINEIKKLRFNSEGYEKSMSLLISNIIIEIYSDLLFLKRDKTWIRIKTYTENVFFESLKGFSSDYYVFERLLYVLSFLDVTRASRREEDGYLDEIIEKCLAEMFLSAKRSKSLANLWTTYVYADCFNCVDIFFKSEESIIKLMPNFDGDNYYHLIESSYDSGILLYLDNLLKGEPVRRFGNNKLYRHVVKVLQESNLKLYKYIACLYGNNIFEEIITQKIEERLFLLFGNIKHENRKIVMNAINNSFDTNSYFYFMLLKYAKNPSYKSLGLCHYEKMAETKNVNWAYFVFRDFWMCNLTEESKNSIGFYFDYYYLALQAKKERNEVIDREEEVGYLDPDVIKGLIKYVWSDECREFLKGKIITE